MNHYKEIQDIDFADGGYILLPQDESKQYPVVYMFHGIGGVQEWKNSTQGNIAARMENVVGNGGTQSILVMPKIRGCANLSEYAEADIEKLMVNGAWDQFFHYDVGGLIKYVNATYGRYVMTGKKNTAITGFSMGATAALYYAVKNRELFGSVGAVSVSSITQGISKQKDFVLDNEKSAIHFIGYGTYEGSGFVTANQYCIDAFNKNNVAITVKKNEGTGHSFATFNPLLSDFLGMIFKD